MALIVLIDDDESLRTMLTKMCERLGHEVLAESNGSLGLKRVRQARPQVVITDILMPEKEGVETIMELRREFPKLKIIAMSGGGRNSASDYLSMARKFGAAFTLAKPFGREELKNALESVLAEPQSPKP